MPLFICNKCGCIDNTAMDNTYWLIQMYEPEEKLYSDEWYNTHPVCTECNNLTSSDGSVIGTGKWHGKFEKKHWTSYSVDELVNLCTVNLSQFLLEYNREIFKKYKEILAKTNE